MVAQQVLRSVKRAAHVGQLRPFVGFAHQESGHIGTSQAEPVPEMGLIGGDSRPARRCERPVRAGFGQNWGYPYPVEFPIVSKIERNLQKFHTYFRHLPKGIAATLP